MFGWCNVDVKLGMMVMLCFVVISDISVVICDVVGFICGVMFLCVYRFLSVVFSVELYLEGNVMKFFIVSLWNVIVVLFVYWFWVGIVVMSGFCDMMREWMCLLDVVVVD